MGGQRARRRATPKDKPAPLTFQDGWNIKPDMIVEMPKEFHVAATGTINYQNIRVKVNFPEDKWVVAAEMRPGNPKVVHHMRVIVRAAGSHLDGERPCPVKPTKKAPKEWAARRKAPICWANTIPGWARKAST